MQELHEMMVDELQRMCGDNPDMWMGATAVIGLMAHATDFTNGPGDWSVVMMRFNIAVTDVPEVQQSAGQWRSIHDAGTN